MSTKEPTLLRLRGSTYTIVSTFLVLLAGLTAIEVGWPELLGQERYGLDYTVFVLAGDLAREGQLATAYSAVDFEAHQIAQPEKYTFMPWTYPPQFNFVAMALSLFPIGVGFLIFVLGTLFGFIYLLRRLSPVHGPQAMILTLPAILMCIRAGQNGLLTAILFALVFLFALRARPIAAGVSLGLLAYKPHLGLGLGLAALLRGGVRMWLTASVVLTLALLLSTGVFGTQIWTQLLQAVRESGIFLRAGAYPMERMVSVYAFLMSLGLPATVAMTAQVAMALTALGLITYVAMRGWQMRSLLAISTLAGMTLSPYAYDYDLVAIAPALAISLPVFVVHAGLLERRALIGGLMFATGWGLLMKVTASTLETWQVTAPSLAAPGLLLALVMMTRVLARAEAAEKIAHGPAGADVPA